MHGAGDQKDPEQRRGNAQAEQHHIRLRGQTDIPGVEPPYAHLPAQITHAAYAFIGYGVLIGHLQYFTVLKLQPVRRFICHAHHIKIRVHRIAGHICGYKF